VAVQTIGRLHAAVAETLTALSHMAPKEHTLATPDVTTATVELNLEFGHGLVTGGGVPQQPSMQLRLEAPTKTPQGALTASAALLMLTDGKTQTAPAAPVRVDPAQGDTAQAARATSQALVKWDADYQNAASVKVNEKAVARTMGQSIQLMHTYRAETNALVLSQGPPSAAKGVHVFDWAKVVAVANADIANLAAAVTGAYQNAMEMFQGYTTLQRDANAMRTELQSFISLSTNIIGSYNNATNTFLGGDEQKFIGTVNLAGEVQKLMTAVGGGRHWWVQQSHQLLRTTFLTLACMARGRAECDQLLRQRLAVAAPESIPRGIQLLLDPDTKQRIIGQSSGPATQLVHWNLHAPETADWIKGMAGWSITAQSDLMALPDECMPGVMELFHATSSEAILKPHLLCLNSWAFDGVMREIRRQHQGKWFAMQRVGSIVIPIAQPARFPLPCDINTIVLTVENWENSVRMLREYFALPDLDPQSVMPNAQIELVHVNQDTGRVMAFPDKKRNVTPAVIRLEGGRRMITVVPSLATTTADLVVRVRWLRFARRLRDFESLTRVPIDQAEALLDQVYETANHSLSVFTDLPLLEAPDELKHLENAPASMVHGKTASESYEESLQQIKEDGDSYIRSMAMQLTVGRRPRSSQRQMQLYNAFSGTGGDVSPVGSEIDY
jgi:hypothetical protein